MKKHKLYSAPSMSTVEVAIESGIAQSAAGNTPGTPGTVDYNPDDDHYEF